MSFVQRELPIKITFSSAVKRPKKLQQHIKRVWIAGPEDFMPEELELDADDVASGGVMLVEDLLLPEDCEVVDRRGNDPVVTVPKASKDKHHGRGRRDGHDDYDD
ncbi:hypothetical protein [Stieleria varia]|uniref:50S ribosomal protein L25/general stress protein Ctc n=1 Tax=Stieleria varia TaxID=2528005 RepID=A0A5C6A401_9BACT|nr:hypothetical protein [Stieleria varia]TWT93998.1 50S ribosomal protein L25/general stress protein Ctc [Stieleria varia]